MKKILYTICLGLVSLGASVSAATIELMPEITAITGQSYDSAGRLANNTIKAADVKGWLGRAGRADGWYTTTGNGSMSWGKASVNTANQTISLPNMPGTIGVCAGLKMTIENIQAYSGLTFSFSLTPPGTGPTYTYSVWYETMNGDLLELCRGSRGNNASQWNVSYDVTDEQLAAMKANGNGKVAHSPNRFETIFRESVLKVDYAGHMVLVKCFSGMANAACEVFDAQTWEGVVGTLSGDDTFFILMRTEENAAEITRQLQRYTVRHT